MSGPAFAAIERIIADLSSAGETIVSPAEDKSAIMRSIAANAGPDTPAGAIVFSLPAAEVAGFGLPDDET